MTEQQIKNRISEIDALIAPIILKSRAIQAAGGVTGLFIAIKQKKNTLNKVGYFLLGSILTGLFTPALFSGELSKLISEKQLLEDKLSKGEYSN